MVKNPNHKISCSRDEKAQVKVKGLCAYHVFGASHDQQARVCARDSRGEERAVRLAVQRGEETQRVGARRPRARRVCLGACVFVSGV